MKKIILRSIMIFLIVSCQNKIKDNNDKLYSEVIDLTNIKDNKKKINLSSIAKNIEYISLESNSECLITSVKDPHNNIKLINNKLFINDDSKDVLVFDNSGKFLNKIGRQGRGPGEFIKANFFIDFYNGKDSLIAVFSDPQRKTFMYDYNGNYQNNLDVNFWPYGLNSISNNLVFINPFALRKPNDYYAISIINSKGTVLKKLLYKGDEKRIEKRKELAPFYSTNNYKFNDSLTYWESSSDTIWRITKDFKAIPKYTLSINDKMPNEKKTLSYVMDIKNSNKYSDVYGIQESLKFFFISVTIKEKLFNIIYDKKSKKSTTCEFKNQFGGRSYRFHNDIDGGFPFWPQGRIGDNKLFMPIYGYEIKDYLERIGDNYEAIDQAARDRLLKLAENSKISDNPILMVVTFNN